MITTQTKSELGILDWILRSCITNNWRRFPKNNTFEDGKLWLFCFFSWRIVLLVSNLSIFFFLVIRNFFDYFVKRMSWKQNKQRMFPRRKLPKRYQECHDLQLIPWYLIIYILWSIIYEYRSELLLNLWWLLNNLFVVKAQQCYYFEFFLCSPSRHLSS